MPNQSAHLLDPYFYVRIGGADGTRIFAAHGGPEAEQPNLGRFVTEVTIEEQADFIGKITVQLNPPRDMGLALLDDPILSLGNVIEVSWGYPSYGFPRRAYGMLTLPDVQLGQDISITLNAEGLAFPLMRSERGIVWRENPADQTSASLSAKAIVTIIAERCGFTGGVVVFHTSPSSKFDVAPATPFTQSETDWIFMRRLARSHGARIFIQNGTHLVVIDNAFETRRFAATFRMFGQLDTKKNVYPMLGFSTEQSGVLIGLASRGVTVQDIDPDKGFGENIGPENSALVTQTPGTVTANNLTSPTKTVGVGAAALGGVPARIPSPAFGLPHLMDVPFDAAKNETGKRLCLSARDPLLDQRAQAVCDESRLRSAVTATIEVIGVPLVFPQDIVKIEGVGRLFENTYLVDKIVHKLGSGYDMTLDLIADTIGTETSLASNIQAGAGAFTPVESPDTAFVSVA